MMYRGAGWHLTSFERPDRVAQKLRSTAHTELVDLRPQLVDIDALSSNIRRGVFDWLGVPHQLLPGSVPEEIAAAYPRWPEFNLQLEDSDATGLQA